MTELPGVPEIHHEHPDVAGGWLRPAVFGAMDGLVSNVALIAGVAGGTQAATGGTGSAAVVLAGLAGLTAGAFSMAVGEYTSVASQVEATQRELRKERREIRDNARAEIAELAQRYVDRGVDPHLALEVAEQIHRDPEGAVAVHAAVELGVNPDELASPKVAAVSSFVAFAMGALIPVLPYLLGATTLWPTVAVTLLALFGCGAVVTRVTVRPWWYGGLRQLLLGAVAAAVTYAVGLAVGGSALG